MSRHWDSKSIIAPGNPARSRNISAAPARTSDGWYWGSSPSRIRRHALPACAAPSAAPLVLAPPMNSVGVRIASASAFENGGRLSRTWPISVIALSRSNCFDVTGRRFQAPGPSRASMKNSRPPSMSPAAIFSADAVNLASERRGAGFESGSSEASSSPPGSARISLRNRSGRRRATRNEMCPPRECPIRSTGPVSSFSMKADHIVDVLGDRIGVADTVPMLGEEVPQRQRDHPMFARQWAEHRRPDAEVAERAVHADQRRTLADLEIDHVVAVDVKRFAWGLGWVADGGGD